MSGVTQEIDVLATQGTKVLAVECKNYDEVRFVGMSLARYKGSPIKLYV